ENSFGADGFRWWNRFQNTHGPYTSSSFHAPGNGWPFYKLPDKRYTTTMYMDAFAKDGHIGLIYTESDPQNQTDVILEALGDSWGTGLWTETYRTNSSYVAIRRYDWTPDCYPRCGARPGARVIPLP